MLELRQAGIPVFLITGNHDAANRMTRSLRLPDNVVMLSADQPETRLLDDLGVAIHGQGFARAAVTEDLSQGYPAGKRGCFNIGLLHTCVTGREGHERYAPCTLDGLRGKKYDYWALGHVHTRDILCEDPPVVFPGNVQGRHIREAGPKGCLVVTVDGGSVSMEFQPLDVMRWQFLSVEAAEKADAEQVARQVSDQLASLRQQHAMPLAVRVEVFGRTAAHREIQADPCYWTNEIRARALEVGEIWLEKVNVRTLPAHGFDPAGDGPIDELLGLLEELRADPSQLLAFARELTELDQLTRKLPAELRQPEGFQPTEPRWLHPILDQAEALLARRLLS
jgi:DNA repair exonuclease SbcCD nuclease subunit